MFYSFFENNSIAPLTAKRYYSQCYCVDTCTTINQQNIKAGLCWGTVMLVQLIREYNMLEYGSNDNTSKNVRLKTDFIKMFA